MQRRPKDVSALEKLTLWHTGVFVVGATWAFGGNADFVQPYLLVLGAGGAAITVAGLLLPGEAEFRRRVLARLWPLLALNALTLWALRTPGFRPIHFGGETMLLPRYVPKWQPSSAAPHLARLTLGLFDSVYLCAFNVLVLVRRRRHLRGLLMVMAGNACALAVFGTIQKLTGARGLYFGRVASPQPYFFATFIYDNHWGAFIVLMVAAALALMGYHARRSTARDVLHSPAFAAGVGVLLLVISVPLSGARICTALVLLVLASALLGWIHDLRERPSGEKGRALAVASVLVVLGFGAVFYVAQETIAARMAKTREQVTEIRSRRGMDNRVRLYRDTWAMAMDRPWFGWGAGSYPHAFQLYNTTPPDPRDHLPKFYHDAHSDWLQSLAEHGVIGTLAIALCAVVPLRSAGARAWNNRLSRRLLIGCAAVLVYAGIEFPFGNFAVLLTWWIVLFVAIRYGVLQENVA